MARHRNPRYRSRVAVLAAVILIVSACSPSDAMPVAFDAMSADQVGCVVEHGDAEYEVGPLGPGSDPVEIEPNSYTLFRFGRTALSLIVVAERERDKATMGLDVASISADPKGTLVHEAAMQDTGNPGYEIRCWAGST